MIKKMTIKFLQLLALTSSARSFGIQRAGPSLARTSLLVRHMSSTNIQTGIVKWFDSTKGFGFIVPDTEGDGDVFVHQTAIKADGFRSLAEGEPVEFSVEVDGNGRRKAINVTGPDGADVQGQPFRPSRDYDGY